MKKLSLKVLWSVYVVVLAYILIGDRTSSFWQAAWNYSFLTLLAYTAYVLSLDNHIVIRYVGASITATAVAIVIVDVFNKVMNTKIMYDTVPFLFMVFALAGIQTTLLHYLKQRKDGNQ